MDLFAQIAAELSTALDRPVVIDRTQTLGGGSINHAFRLDTSAGHVFVKTNHADRADMFAAEAAGLDELAAATALRVPRVLARGSTDTQAWLALDYLELGGPPAPARFGEALAQLHRHTADTFGWTCDNTIGSTAQRNTPHTDWVGFWQSCRLGPQIEFAKLDGAPRGLIGDCERLHDDLPAFFIDYCPRPSLLHGDLWSGNWGYGSDGAPTLFDPAVYYGDREADIAMTELFGTPGAAFYAAYDAAWPRDAGYRVRRTLYNLYHILNHHHLFGGGYASQAARMAGSLRAELRG
ncbi:fructosamine kinase family protein [Acidihalobacter ferrooxydans]|uniref:Fructosamine kinase family protein n=1 Tax=Acidihalobacter ferrooxydans TaxID=1765967 RepID=A0A1P8UKF4_9GAMM|nr:fructosamine kinase family protein [Acidihalobacter ferrooxydans]APZ44242.1 hypothetical protein BW247_15035 [Acidihalobacter ferrooxydans]